MSPQFEMLYQQHVVLAFERQLHLADVIGKRSWSFSMGDGRLTFDRAEAAPMTFTAQLLGTAANDDGSWLWSWANDASNIPATLTEEANRLRQSDTAPEWAMPRLKLDSGNSDEHRVAMTVCGVLGADAYYRGPYQGGAAFFLLRDERLTLPPPEGPRVVRTVMQAISSLAIADHGTALRAYFAQRGLDPRQDADGTIVSSLNGRELRACLDQHGRLTKLDGTLGP